MWDPPAMFEQEQDEYSVPLDGELIDTLASETRRRILKLLRKRRMTGSELARQLDLTKATVHEHLERLAEADLVDRQEDQERMWVYYELSRRGSRVTNPSKSRMHLVIGAAVLAAAAAIAVLLVAQSSLLPWVAPAADLQVDAPRQVTAEDGSLTMYASARTEGGPVDTVSARLLTAEEARRMQDGAAPGGIPLEVAPSDGRIVLSASSVPAGTYRLLVETPDGRSNRHAMAEVQVRRVQFDVSHGAWWTGLSGPLDVRLQGGEPVGPGLLELTPTGTLPANATARTSIEDGAGSFAPETLDALPTGTYRIGVRPDGQAWTFTLDEQVRIRRPEIAVSPHALVEGGNGTVQAGIRGPVLDGPRDEVALDPGSTADVSIHDSRITYHLDTSEPGPVPLRVGRRFQTTVEVRPHLGMNFTLTSPDDLRLQVTDDRGQAVPDAAVYFDGSPVGFTDGNGSLPMDRPGPGTHRIRLRTATDRTLERGIQVQGWNITSIPRKLDVQVTDRRATEDALVVDVAVTNPMAIPETVTIALRGQGGLLASRPVAVEAGANRSLTLRVPGTFEGAQQLRASVEGPDLAPVTFTNRTGPSPGRKTTSPGALDGGTDTAELAPAFEVVDLAIGTRGNPLTLSVTVVNRGTAGGSAELPVRVDGTDRTTVTVEGAPGEETTVMVRVPLEPGTHEIGVGAKTLQLDAAVDLRDPAGAPGPDAADRPTIPAPGWLAAAAAGAVAVLLRRRR